MPRRASCLVIALVTVLTGCTDGPVAPSFASTAAPFAAGSGAARASEARGAGPELCLVTYNMNYGVAGDGGTVDVLDAVDADVIVLQETNAEWEGAIRRRLGSRYADIRFHDPVRLAPGGSGTLSKYPIESEKQIPSAVNWFPATVLVVRTEAGPVQIVNVHLRPMVTDSGSWIKGYFTTGDYRIREIAAIRRELDETLPTIWAGDFNEAEDAGGISGLGASGFVSALPQKDPRAVTWHWDYDGIPLALRLDHVLYDKDDFALEDAEVLGGGRSDHFAVKVTLRRAVTD